MVSLRVEGGEEQRSNRRHRIRLHRHLDRPVVMLGMQPSIKVQAYLPVVVRAFLQTLPIVTHPPGELPGDHAAVEHIGAEAIDHFREDDPGFMVFVRPGEYLTMGGAASIGQAILSAIIHLGVAFGIWFLFMRYYRREAEKMNEKIQEMK